MSDGDWCLAISGDDDSADIYFYRFDGDSTESTDDPQYIEPSAGAGCWVLANIHTIALTGEGDDHYLNVGQSAQPSNPSDGDCFYDTDIQDWCCYNGASWDCVSLD